MADEKDADETESPPMREKATTGVRRRIEHAEELADQAVVAEAVGDHRTAAELYKRAIDALLPVAEGAPANDTDQDEG
jgi:hypothetical protein